MRVPIYLIVKSTGQFDAEGAELTIVLDVKLTRAIADAVCASYRDEGIRVIKMVADKSIPI